MVMLGQLVHKTILFSSASMTKPGSAVGLTMDSLQGLIITGLLQVNRIKYGQECSVVLTNIQHDKYSFLPGFHER